MQSRQMTLNVVIHGVITRNRSVLRYPTVNQNSQFPLQHMMNNFKNDEAYISTKWLLRLINSRGLEIQHLLKIVNRGTKTTHFLAILQNDSYLCDCCMGMNLGIPCRHYFQALTRMPALSFHIGLVRARCVVEQRSLCLSEKLPCRWYQDHNLDIQTMSSVSLENVPRNSSTLQSASLAISSSHISNPLDSSSTQRGAVPPTQTIGAREVYHETHAALKPLINGIHTKEDLDELLQDLDELRYVFIGTLIHSPNVSLRRIKAEEARSTLIHDPPVIQQKGRPRSARLTGAIEGRPRGGGPSVRSRARSENTAATPIASQAHHESTMSMTQKAPRKCGLCRREGHTRQNCDWIR